MRLLHIKKGTNMKLKFVVRASKARKDGQSPIELSIIVNGERSIIALDRKCKATLFNPSTQKVRGDKETNEYITSITNKCYMLDTELTKMYGCYSLLQFIEAFKNGIKKQVSIVKAFNEVIDDVRSKKENGKLTRSTLSKYVTTLEYLIQYLKEKHNTSDITLSSLTSGHINKFYDFLCTKLCNNSAVQKMKTLKSVLLYCVDEGYMTTSPFKAKLHIDKLEYHPLSIYEVNKIMDKNISNERLSKVRDLFVFQCMTGLAYADMAALTKSDIQDGVIVRRRMKTKVQSIIPILDVTRTILEKYDYKLPVLSNQKYNSYLKELGDICGIEQELHSHLARHTCATILLNQGVALTTVSKVLGHSNSKITESVYAQLQTKTIVAEVNNIMGNVF